MEINEYVRTKDGIIKRVSSYNPQENNPLWETLNGNVQIKGTITKHSKDIIDLIEVGDYVNGRLVVSIMYDAEDRILGIETLGCLDFENDEIKSILTHEQFEVNAYTIEKER